MIVTGKPHPETDYNSKLAAFDAVTEQAPIIQELQDKISPLKAQAASTLSSNTLAPPSNNSQRSGAKKKGGQGGRAHGGQPFQDSSSSSHLCILWAGSHHLDNCTAERSSKGNHSLPRKIPPLVLVLLSEPQVPPSALPGTAPAAEAIPNAVTDMTMPMSAVCAVLWTIPLFLNSALRTQSSPSLLPDKINNMLFLPSLAQCEAEEFCTHFDSFTHHSVFNILSQPHNMSPDPQVLANSITEQAHLFSNLGQYSFIHSFHSIHSNTSLFIHSEFRNSKDNVESFIQSFKFHPSNVVHDHPPLLDPIPINTLPFVNDLSYSKIITPYSSVAFNIFLVWAEVPHLYPHLVEKLESGFPLGPIPVPTHLYTLDNLSSLNDHVHIAQE